MIILFLPRKGLNFPDSKLGLIPALSDKDKEDAKFGVKMGVDLIALSFCEQGPGYFGFAFSH